MLTIGSRREKRETLIRSSLLDHLKESVQSLIQGPGGQGIPRLSSNDPNRIILGHSDNTNLLCSVLEAILIHGLKDSFGEKLSSLFLGDLDRMPVPNFWPLIIAISHRDLMEQVSSLSFIVSDVGKARAWMRLALNQGQLISYLSILASDAQILKDHYRTGAFLRDVESCDIMLRVLQPISGISFSLSTNSSILNTWTQTPLVISGTWVPPNYEQTCRDGPIMSATDVASTFYDVSCEDVGIPVPQTPISDQMFELILGGTPKTQFINENNFDSIGDSTDIRPLCQEVKMIDTSKISKALNTNIDCEELFVNNSEQPMFQGKFHETSSINPEKEDNDCEVIVEENVKDLKEEATENLPGHISLHASSEQDTVEGACSILISPSSMSSETLLNRSISCDPDSIEYRSLFTDWEHSETVDNLPPFLKMNFPLESEKSDCLEEENIDFEILSSNLPLEEEIHKYLPIFTRLQKEDGLDTQNYQCYEEKCKVPIGMIYGKPRFCYFNGKYYCFECHQEDFSLIPARIIHNWDFTQYSVSKANKLLLDSVYRFPFINIRLLNPEIYKYADQMAELQSLRRQLHYIQAYLFTCQTSFKGQELRKMLWPREHLYEHVHLYSVYDLEQVNNGKLIPIIRDSVQLGTDHIMKCPNCAPRGFICEVCKKDEIIYPFKLGDTFTCFQCSGVFHIYCVKQQTDCPKCKRIERRKAAAEEDRS